MDKDTYYILFQSLITDFKNIIDAYSIFKSGGYYQNALYLLEQIEADIGEDECGVFSKYGRLVRYYKYLVDNNFFLETPIPKNFDFKTAGSPEYFRFPEAFKVKHLLKELYPNVSTFKKIEG